MKIYKHSEVNYLTDIFSDLKSFDVVGIDELLILHEKLVKTFPRKRRMVNGPYGSILIKEDIHYPHTYDEMRKLGRLVINENNIMSLLSYLGVGG